MRVRSIGLWAAALVLSAASVFAQQNASVSGIVTDESKGVLPGVTVTVTSLDSGRVSSAVTDAKGEYLIVNLPPGRYSLGAELAGFGSATVPALELRVGQNATLPLSLKVGSLAETITVTGESPLVDITSSEVAGNVDRRQMEELPLAGRNWMELSLQVKGITANNVDNRPGVGADDAFQLNLDGQQITNKVASSGFGQPKFSREAIAEFQIITNLFDITQGRSTGVQVQAISKSGSNVMHGSVYGYFRDDKWNSADFVAKRVLPYQNQQTGVSLGGPIKKDKLHYFGQLRVRARAEHGVLRAGEPALAALLGARQAGQPQRPRPRRPGVDGQVAPLLPATRSGASTAPTTSRPSTRRSRRRAPARPTTSW